MMKPIKRLPSADWQTDDLHVLWAEASAESLGNEFVAIHAFLDYCRLLQDVRDSFVMQDRQSPFDRVFFFLRGGYFAFAYLNMTFELLDRAVIFGGLNHGGQPVDRLKDYLRKLASAARDQGERRLRILVIDEVKSGTGMGRALKIIEGVLREEEWRDTVDCDLTFYAIRPGQKMTPELEGAAKRWSGARRNRAPGLSIAIVHFAGHLPGYDDDRRCGIKRTSDNRDSQKDYDLVKHATGKVRFVCNRAKPRIAFAQLEGQCLVEFLSNLAVWLTNKPTGSIISSIQFGVESRGCEHCRQCFTEVRKRSSVTSGLQFG
jgi:hypothetical protein